MGPFGVEGAISYNGLSVGVQACNGSYWITAVNGTTSTAGCSIISSLEGQLVYNSGLLKFCLFNAGLIAYSMKGPLTSVASCTTAGQFYYSVSTYKEVVFCDGSNLWRSRSAPVIVSTPNTYAFIVPYYKSQITFKIWGGGGSGAGYTSMNTWLNCGVNTCTPGVAGTASSISAPVSMTANGGGRGNNCGTSGFTAGAGGTASGGTINTSGTTANSRNGANAPNGGTGGVVNAANSDANGVDGTAPGAGGSGSRTYQGLCTVGYGAGGSSGGYSEKSYSLGGIAPGTYVTVTVGAGGTGSPGQNGTTSGDGGNGQVSITWD